MGTCLTAQNFESCSAASKLSFTTGAIILTEISFLFQFLSCGMFFKYSIKPCEEVNNNISSLADCNISSYFFLTASASLTTKVLGIGLPVSISAIFLSISVEFLQRSSNIAKKETTMELQFVQRHRLSCSDKDPSTLGLMKNTTSSSSLMTMRGNNLKPKLGFLISKCNFAFGVSLRRAFIEPTFCSVKWVRNLN